MRRVPHDVLAAVALLLDACLNNLFANIILGVAASILVVCVLLFVAAGVLLVGVLFLTVSVLLDAAPYFMAGASRVVLCVCFVSLLPFLLVAAPL